MSDAAFRRPRRRHPARRVRRVRHSGPPRCLGADRARPPRPPAPRPGSGGHRLASTAASSIPNASSASSAITSPIPRPSPASPATWRWATSATRPPARRSSATCSRCSPSSKSAASPSRHNGNFTNGLTLRRQLIAQGAICQSTSDTEVVLHLIARSRKTASSDRFVDALSHLEGAYSLVALTRTKLIGARDPNGIRPLVLGELDGKPIFASETCALDIIGARFVRDVENGEVVICEQQPDGSITIDSLKPFPPKPERLCLFEYVYFARPDSVVGGRSVYGVRKAHGREPGARSAGRGRRRRAGARRRHTGGDRLSRRRAASRSSSASSATTTSAAPSSSRRSRSAPSA